MHTFYSLVFADTPNAWFRDAFARIGDLEHHVATQAAFWEDVMGGGRRYHGGEYRLHFHHTNNAAAVMNAKGATRWMFHMRHALQTHAAQLSRCDSRAVPCILQVVALLFAAQGIWELSSGAHACPRAVPSLPHAKVRRPPLSASKRMFMSCPHPQVRAAAWLAPGRGRFSAFEFRAFDAVGSRRLRS